MLHIFTRPNSRRFGALVIFCGTVAVSGPSFASSQTESADAEPLRVSAAGDQLRRDGAREPWSGKTRGLYESACPAQRLFASEAGEAREVDRARGADRARGSHSARPRRHDSATSDRGVATRAGAASSRDEGDAATLGLDPSASDGADVADLVRGAPTGDERIPADRPGLERAIFAVTNEVRLARGLEPLGWDDDAARAARYHAADMKVNDYFSHDTRVPSPSDEPEVVMGAHERMRTFGAGARGGAENIAYNATEDAERVVSQWMASDGHRRNILDPHVRTLGVGHHDGYWVQKFAY